MRVEKRTALGLSVAGLGLLLDQLSKTWSHAWVAVHGPQEVFPSLTIIATSNTGMAFSLGEGSAVWILIGVALLVCGWLLWWLLRAQGMAEASGLGLAIGGALGNVLDRLRFGAVRDFIDVYWRDYHWPAFNVADVAILVGLIIVISFHKDGTLNKKRSKAADGPVERHSK
jgi:signal peptidase II